jgi:hypothetical protein
MRTRRAAGSQVRGKAPQMVEYYSYWEQEIYNALTQLIITAMQVCQSVKSGRAAGAPQSL